MMNSKNKIAFLIGALFLSQVAVAAQVSSYSCKTMKEHHKDPTPVKAFSLQSNDRGLFSAKFSSDTANKKDSVLARDLTCQFRRAMDCKGLKYLNGPCSGIGPSHKDWATPRSNGVIFSCSNKNKQTIESMLRPLIRISHNGNLRLHTVAVEISGFNTDKSEYSGHGVFQESFPMAFKCVVKSK